jgi:hypothetical protein
MMDFREILDKGRCKDGHGCNCVTLCMCATLEDACDEIDRLRAEIDRLRAEILLVSK